MSGRNSVRASVMRAGAKATLLAGALLAGGCQGPYLTEEAYYVDPPPTPLTGEEIQRLLVGNSVVSDAAEGPYAIFFPDAGQILGQHSRHYRDRGQWRVDEGQICAIWENWWGNTERCWQVLRDGEDITWLDPHGNAEADDARLVGGNPEGLE